MSFFPKAPEIGTDTRREMALGMMQRANPQTPQNFLDPINSMLSTLAFLRADAAATKERKDTEAARNEALSGWIASQPNMAAIAPLIGQGMDIGTVRDLVSLRSAMQPPRTGGGGRPDTFSGSERGAIDRAVREMMDADPALTRDAAIRALGSDPVWGDMARKYLPESAFAAPPVPAAPAQQDSRGWWDGIRSIFGGDPVAPPPAAPAAPSVSAPPAASSAAPPVPAAPGPTVMAEPPSMGGPGMGPQPGTVMDGYRFLGGDPADEKNWKKV